MGLEDLAASQPTDASQSDESVMVDEGSSAPQIADGDEQAASEPQDNSDGGQEDSAIKAMQKRIDRLTGKNKEFEEKYIQERAARETLEKVQSQSQPQTLQDLDVKALNNFIAKAESDPELESYLPEARLELQRKLVQEELSGFKQELTQKQQQERGQAMTNNIINNLSSGKLSDQNSEYYNTVVANLSELQSDQFNGIDVNQVLAVALAENEYLKSQQGNQLMSAEDRVVKNRNRNNNIQSNDNRIVNGSGSDDLANFLKDNPSLTRSNQAGKGGIKDALRKLNTVQGFDG